MTQTIAEALLLASVVANAALLIFIAGVLRHIMNEMDAPAFKNFAEGTVRHSSRSPFMIIALNLPAAGAIPYYYYYGFGNHWVDAGLAAWLAIGLVSKAVKLPVYGSIKASGSDDVARLTEQRRRLNAGNVLQATGNSIAVAFMVVGLFR